MPVTLNVYFTNVIDTESYCFQTKREAITIVQGLTKNRLTGFDWNDEGEYKYLLFREVVQCSVDEAKNAPLYTLIEDVVPSIEGGEFSSVSKARLSDI